MLMSAFLYLCTYFRLREITGWGQEHNTGILLTWIGHTQHPSIRDNPQILHLSLSRPSFFLQHSSHLRVQTTGYCPPDPFRRQATSNPLPPLNSEICSRPLGIPC